MNGKLYPNLNTVFQNQDEMFNQNIYGSNFSENNGSWILGYCEEEYKKFEKEYNIFESLNKYIHTIESFITIGSTSTSIQLSMFGLRLLVVPITAGIGCGVAISTELASDVLRWRRNFTL